MKFNLKKNYENLINFFTNDPARKLSQIFGIIFLENFIKFLFKFIFYYFMFTNMTRVSFFILKIFSSKYLEWALYNRKYKEVTLSFFGENIEIWLLFMFILGCLITSLIFFGFIYIYFVLEKKVELKEYNIYLIQFVIFFFLFILVLLCFIYGFIIGDFLFAEAAAKQNCQIDNTLKIGYYGLIYEVYYIILELLILIFIINLKDNSLIFKIIVIILLILYPFYGIIYESFINHSDLFLYLIKPQINYMINSSNFEDCQKITQFEFLLSEYDYLLNPFINAVDCEQILNNKRITPLTVISYGLCEKIELDDSIRNTFEINKSKFVYLKENNEYLKCVKESLKLQNEIDKTKVFGDIKNILNKIKK